MATIWFKQTEHGRYEVRTAGNSLRLYTNGVFHSQWNSKKPLAGHLWDLLFLPLCFKPDFPSCRSALILGVGGGAIINLLQHFCLVKKITAVDLDPEHFFVAKHLFGIEQGAALVDCVEQDAKVFIERNTKKYDFILEDLFLHQKDANDAARAIDATEEWLAALSSALTVKGLLVMNFESLRQLQRSLPKATLARLGFKCLVEFSLPRYENGVALLSKIPCDQATFQQNVKQLERAANFRFARNEYVMRIRWQCE